MKKKIIARFKKNENYLKDAVCEFRHQKPKIRNFFLQKRLEKQKVAEFHNFHGEIHLQPLENMALVVVTIPFKAQ